MAEASESAGGGEVLSQSEVDSLLAQVASQENAGAVVALQSGAPVETGDGPQPYDFRHPSFLSPALMRQLRLRYEGFIRALGARLSIYMRLEFALQMTKLHAIQYRKFIDSLPKTTHLSLFKVEPLRGIGILNIPPRLGLSIVERLLGGQAQAVTAEHDPSEIELALLDQAVELVLAEWCNNWAGVEELTPSLLGHETSGQFMHTASHDAMMLVLAMEAKVGDCTEQIHLAMPCSALEPLIHKLNQATTSAAEETPRLPAAPLKWNRNFDEVPVPVTAIWDDLVLTAREVANLKPGDILPLDPRTTRQVTLRLADTPRFQGSLGTTSGKWAVAVTSVMKGALNP